MPGDFICLIWVVHNKNPLMRYHWFMTIIQPVTVALLLRFGMKAEHHG